MSNHCPITTYLIQFHSDTFLRHTNVPSLERKMQCFFLFFDMSTVPEPICTAIIPIVHRSPISFQSVIDPSNWIVKQVIASFSNHVTNDHFTYFTDQFVLVFHLHTHLLKYIKFLFTCLSNLIFLMKHKMFI